MALHWGVEMGTAASARPHTAAALADALEKLDSSYAEIAERCREIGVDEAKVQLLVRTIESRYKDVPYHNSSHAADVVTASCVLPLSPSNCSMLSNELDPRFTARC